MNIAALHRRSGEEHGPVLPDHRDPDPLRLLGGGQGMGPVGSPGTVREAWFATEAEALRDGLELCRRKERRGYKPPALA